MSRWSFLGTKGCSKIQGFNSWTTQMKMDNDDRKMLKCTRWSLVLTVCLLGLFHESCNLDLSVATIRVEPGWVTLLKKFPTKVDNRSDSIYVRHETNLVVFSFSQRLNLVKKFILRIPRKSTKAHAGSLFQIYSGNPGDETRWLESKTGQGERNLIMSKNRHRDVESGKAHCVSELPEPRRITIADSIRWSWCTHTQSSIWREAESIVHHQNYQSILDLAIVHR